MANGIWRNPPEPPKIEASFIVRSTGARMIRLVSTLFCLSIFVSAAIGGQAAPTQGRSTAGSQPPAAASLYVQRMMSLDRNKDGFLSKSELPGSLQSILKHDSDKDGRLSKAELTAIETGAIRERADKQASPEQRRNGRGGAGRRGSQRNLPQGAAGSPLDPQQIIRFALTFDADHDGGLNAEELNRYAVALAARRARGRRQPSTNSGEAVPQSATSPQKPPVQGLGASGAKDDPSNPFGPPR